ncbi:uncharacterized protein LOC113300527 [Papaver somniferum]|uniref:uncharacterized protein LOC113300527 n=1 Tax=Papaver somniferum TaxID=3469 RepID=UPI000E6FDE7E|nr:uncharacterized protein LOC113300527 [Papaver somniferum]
MGFVGPAFTWSNGAVENEPIFEILDRAMCTQDWFFMFQEKIVLNLPRISSDHAPILVNTHRTGKRKRQHANKFEFYWINHPAFQDVVHDAWLSNPNETTRKIGEVGEELNKWSRKNFGNIFRDDEELKEKLLKRRYYEHRSKVKWVPNIDKNTKAFHMSVLQRKKKNQIDAVKLPNGLWVTDAKGIVQYLVEHFTDIFKRDPDEMKHPIQFQTNSRIDNSSNANIPMVPMKE